MLVKYLNGICSIEFKIIGIVKMIDICFGEILIFCEINGINGEMIFYVIKFVIKFNVCNVSWEIFFFMFILIYFYLI